MQNAGDLVWLANVSNRAGRAVNMSYPDYRDYRDSAGGVLIWDPQTGVKSDEVSLPQPVGALSWLNDASLLIADWSGQSQVFEAATGGLSPGLKVQKTLVSAANWSPDCPLVTPWQVQELAQGTAR